MTTGAIAQLVERDDGIVEVSGSIPLSSISFLLEAMSVIQYNIPLTLK